MALPVLVDVQKSGNDYGKTSPNSSIPPPSKPQASPLSDPELRPTLETLPSLVLERVLDFLLTAQDVVATCTNTNNMNHLAHHQATIDPQQSTEQTFESSPLRPYKFCTAIMRVNKAMYSVATSVFERNHFCLVSTNEISIGKIMNKNHLWYRQKKIAPFKRYHLRLHVNPLLISPESDSKKPYFFMICLDNLREFVRVLEEMELGSTEGRRFRFKIEFNHCRTQALSSKTQRLLMSSLTELRGCGQTCNIGGMVDGEVANQYRSMLADQVIWVRGREWQFLDFIKYKKSVGDRLFQINNYAAAHLAYFEWFNYNFNAPHILHGLLNGDDENLVAEYEYVRGITQINFNATVIMIYAAAPVEQRPQLLDMVHKSQAEIISNTHLKSEHLTRNQGHVTIANIYTKNWSAAKDALQKASSSGKDNKNFAKCIKLLHNLEKGRTLGQGSATDLKELINMLHKSTLLLPIPNRPVAKKSYLATAEFERYILNRLSYTGNLLEEHVKQKPGWTMDKDEEIVHKPFDRWRRKNVTKGRRNCWI